MKYYKHASVPTAVYSVTSRGYLKSISIPKTHKTVITLAKPTQLMFSEINLRKHLKLYMIVRNLDRTK